jgi:hypothetical protein
MRVGPSLMASLGVSRYINQCSYCILHVLIRLSDLDGPQLKLVHGKDGNSFEYFFFHNRAHIER